MNYATQDDFLATLSQDIIDDLGSDPDDRDVLKLVMERAEAYIHGFIADKALPVTAPLSVEILKHHTLNIARAFLLERRLGGRYAESSMEFFRVSKEWLEQYAKGQASLPDRGRGHGLGDDGRPHRRLGHAGLPRQRGLERVLMSFQIAISENGGSAKARKWPLTPRRACPTRAACTPRSGTTWR